MRKPPPPLRKRLNELFEKIRNLNGMPPSFVNDSVKIEILVSTFILSCAEILKETISTGLYFHRCNSVKS